MDMDFERKIRPHGQEIQHGGESHPHPDWFALCARLQAALEVRRAMADRSGGALGAAMGSFADSVAPAVAGSEAGVNPVDSTNGNPGARKIGPEIETNRSGDRGKI